MSTGLYQKFRVTRRDGSSRKGCKHAKCEYVRPIENEVFAALAYANACESEYPILARDLRARAGIVETE